MIGIINKYYLKNTKDQAPIICIDSNGKSYEQIKQKFIEMLNESEKQRSGKWIIYRDYWQRRKRIEELKVQKAEIRNDSE